MDSANKAPLPGFESAGYSGKENPSLSPEAWLGESFEIGTRGRRELPSVGRLIVPLLGLFFLVYPIMVVFASEPTSAQVFFALSGAALFAGIFLWLMWLHEPLQLAPPTPSQVLKYRAVIVFLAVLAGVLSFFLGPEWRMLFFYHINVAAGIMLLRTDAYIMIAGITVITLLLGFPVGLAWLAVPALVLGLWATTFVSQAAVVAELRTAREALARHAVAEERLRFARDLHDLLGHSLSLITLKSELASRLLPAAPERAAKEIHEVEAVARRALREVREAVAGYRQPTLVEELHEAKEMLAAAGIASRIEHGVGLLPKSVEAILAWTVREGTTNVIRHSRARHCAIRLVRDAGEVYVEVGDDGRGVFAARDRTGRSAGGSGLAGLAERIADFAGANFEAGPRPEGGFRLRVSLPLQHGDAHEEEPQ
jgi:two-component system, NarL family, sensor histidine kinase DesK